MKSALSALQEKRDAFDKMKKNYEDTVTCIQVQWYFLSLLCIECSLVRP